MLEEWFKTNHGNCFYLPLVKTQGQENDDFKLGIGSLVELLERRLELTKLFTSKKILQELIKMSGGNLRDLMNLIQHAQ